MIRIRSTSYFKNAQTAEKFFRNWVERVKELSGTDYERINVRTSLGNTVVWGINTKYRTTKTIAIFPGFRTCSLFWDMDNALESLKKEYRIFLVDTNGQPCLSEGNAPDIKSIDYGVWAAEVLQKLSVTRAVIAGASFGALICLKLCVVAPHLVKKAILLNPGCLQSFSLSPKNIYYNLLPLLFPNKKNVGKFLDKAVFYKNKHTVSAAAKNLMIDYELFAITQFKNKAQRPYAMNEVEMQDIEPDVYLILGDKDILFPYQRSLDLAQQNIPTLRKTYILKDTGHGIETSKQAISIVSKIIANDEWRNRANDHTYHASKKGDSHNCIKELLRNQRNRLN